jgi:signal transduction histidine kinase
MRNLLENARRYGGTGAITLSLGVIHLDGKAFIELRVCDHGPGVPAEMRERIFEPFFRLPGASEREGGVGLGLALVRAIALRHGGSAHCEAARNADGGSGACFVLHLPASTPINQDESD